MNGCCRGRAESKSRTNRSKTVGLATPLGTWSVKSTLKRKRDEYEQRTKIADKEELDYGKYVLLEKVLSTKHFVYSAYSPYCEIPQIVIHIFSREGLRKHGEFLKSEWSKHEMQFSVQIGDIVGDANKTANVGTENPQSPHSLKPSEFEVYLNGDRVDSAQFVRDLRHRVNV